MSSRSIVATRSLVVLVVGLGLSACSLTLEGTRGPLHQKKVITASEIRHLGAENAWDVLEREGTGLQASEAGPQEKLGTVARLRRLPRVIVDGVQMFELRLLKDLPANLIASIRILTGSAGEAEGGDGADEVILIKTRDGR